MLLLVAMVTRGCFAFLTALARSILVEVTEVACVNQCIMLGSEVDHNEAVALGWSSLNMRTYPRNHAKGLLTDGCVHSAQAPAETWMDLGRALALLVVLFGMPFVDDVVLELCKLWVRLGGGLIFAVPVHDKSVAFLIQRQHLSC